jgi:ATP-dependent RNA helicase RhlE
MHFKELNLIEPILAALKAKGYEEPTPIQAAAIPSVLAGKDVLGCAQTGTGKTAAFALPILQNLLQNQPAKAGGIRALILSPTRELAVQIGESFNLYGRGMRLRVATIFGGVSDMPQKQKLRQGVDILVATPGRLMDLHAQRALSLDRVEIFTLDEADRMMDMGFIHDVRRIAALVPAQRQTLFFSATMPPEIRSLAKSLLRDPVHIEVTPVSSAAPNIDQAVYMVSRNTKPNLLGHLLSDPTIRRALVFTRTKHGADRVCKSLERYRIFAEALHGNKTQGARQRALNNFKNGQTRILVATDIASRGIDVTDISHVFNFDLPEVPETYVHRIGRTARAGTSGIAYTFCDSEERSYLTGIERLLRQRLRVMPIPVMENMPAPIPQSEPGTMRPRSAAPSRGPQRPYSGSSHSGQGGNFRPRSEGSSSSSSNSSSPREPQRSYAGEGEGTAQHGRRPFWQKSRPAKSNRY